MMNTKDRIPALDQALVLGLHAAQNDPKKIFIIDKPFFTRRKKAAAAFTLQDVETIYGYCIENRVDIGTPVTAYHCFARLKDGRHILTRAESTEDGTRWFGTTVVYYSLKRALTHMDTNVISKLKLGHML